MPNNGKSRGRKTLSSPSFVDKFGDSPSEVKERLAGIEANLHALQALPSEVRDAALKLAEQKGSIDTSRIWGAAIAALLTAILVTMVTFGVSMYGDIATLKGQSPSSLGKEAKLLISKPATDSSANFEQANYLLVRAAKMNGVPAGVLSDVASGLSGVSQQQRKLNAYWRTLSTVVNLKDASLGKPALPPHSDCLDPSGFHYHKFTQDPSQLVPMDANGNVLPDYRGPIGSRRVVNSRLFNCRLQADDVEAFQKSLIGKSLAEDVAILPGAIKILSLYNVQLRYSGGLLLPFDRIICHNCSYVLDLSQPPPAAGESLSSQLLVADLTQPVLSLALHVSTPSP